VDFGTGESSSQSELGGYGVPRDEKRDQWDEALDAIARMFVEEPFAGYEGKYLKMPPRNVVPKPLQKPHPPLWVACSRRDTILLAAKKGIGALSFSFVEPEDAKEWVDAYYATLQSEECVAAGFAVNPNIAVVVPFMCHPDEQTAIERGIDGAHFFGYSLAHYYVFGRHVPGRTNVWDEFEEHRSEFGFAREIVTPDAAPLGVKLLQAGLGSLRGAVGTPKQIAELVERYEKAGVDQIIFVAQAGRNQHEHICESLELFGKEILPRFAEEANRKDEERNERLRAACEQALLRRRPRREADPTYTITADGEPRPAPRVGYAIGDGKPHGLAERLRQRGQEAFAGYLKGKSDNQLDRIVGSPVTLRMVFKAMERQFQPQHAAGFSGSIQYELVGRQRKHVWAIDVRDGRAHAHAGRSPSPAVTLRMSVPTFARILSDEVDAGKAWFTGAIAIDGDLSLAARLADMFGRAHY
jgi:alkanesulfonate monooxygenase SsuD/methylene tetrahydromethanopterin reductase-like flavin-dependent oxidoreductase (luciferase family)